MKILLITNKPIYPKNDGGCVAMDNFLSSLLSAKFEVKHLAIGTEKHPFDERNYPLEIREKIAPIGINISTKVKIGEAFKNLFMKGSYNVKRFYSEKMKNEIATQLNKNKFDVVILESLYSTIYLDDIRKLFKGKVFTRIHNIEADIWKNYWQNETSFLKKIYLRKLHKDLSKYEIDTFSKIDGILAISNDDANAISKLDIRTPVKVIPVAISNEVNSIDTYSSNSVFHLGAMDWQPNIEAVDRLIKIHSLSIERGNAFELIIAGKNIEKFNLKSRSDKITNLGFVSDLDKLSQTAGILVSPVISGSGVRIKILEMMARGIPVITSEIGAKGIDYKKYNCLYVADDDIDFTRKIKTLQENQQLRMELGQNAISYIQKFHSIDEITKQLGEFIQTK